MLVTSVWMEGFDAMRRLFTVLFAVLLFSSFVVVPSEAGAYARCNCTAWAHSKRRDLPLTLGHARTWGVRAKAQGFPVDGKPRVGDVMVLLPGVQGAHRRYGHVAYVIAVKGNRVTVSEMNGGQGCGVKRDTYRTGRGVSFIHPK
jgi:surface antigen